MSKELETQREHAGMSEGDHKRFMRRAIELALEGAVKKKAGACFGAVIVKDGEIVGEGHNQVGVDSDPTAHGEITAIRKACKNLGTPSLEGCVMYSSAEPCYMCAAASYWAKLSKVYYAARTCDIAPLGAFEVEGDPFKGNEPALPTGQRRNLPFEMLLNEEGVAAIRAYVDYGAVFKY